MSDSDDEDPGRQAARTVTTERWGIKGKSTAISTCACRFQNRLPGGRGGAGGAWWWLYVRETELEMAGGHCQGGTPDTCGGCSFVSRGCARVTKESSLKQTQYSLLSPQRMVPPIYVSMVSLD